MNDNDHALCVTLAALLRANGAIAAWGLALSCIAGLVLALTGRSLPTSSWATWAAVALFGMLERWFAVRLRFEAALFEGAMNTSAPWHALEASATRLGLRKPSDTAPKLEAHVAATRKLMQRHGLVVVLQTLLVALALALQDAR